MSIGSKNSKKESTWLIKNSNNFFCQVVKLEVLLAPDDFCANNTFSILWAELLDFESLDAVFLIFIYKKTTIFVNICYFVFEMFLSYNI